MSNQQTIIAFDLYGTLLSTESMAQELARYFGNEKAQSIAALWRRYQLEYTFRMNSMLLYKPFSEVTQTSLHHALAEHRLTISDPDVEKIMKSYNALSTFPDVIPGLQILANDPNISAYVFSNGTSSMIHDSVYKSSTLSSCASIFKDLITVEEVSCYKPHPRVYEHLIGKTKSEGVSGEEHRENVWLVSGNPFDIVGAKACGLKTCWIDRAEGHHGEGGWNDRLGELASGGPDVVVEGVEEAVKSIQRMSGV